MDSPSPPKNGRLEARLEQMEADIQELKNYILNSGRSMPNQPFVVQGINPEIQYESQVEIQTYGQEQAALDESGVESDGVQDIVPLPLLETDAMAAPPGKLFSKLSMALFITTVS